VCTKCTRVKSSFDCVKFSGRRGLLNLGQTCFLNVVLQSFVHNPLLRNYFLSDKHNSKLHDHPICTCCEMDRLFAEVGMNSLIVNVIAQPIINRYIPRMPFHMALFLFSRRLGAPPRSYPATHNKMHTNSSLQPLTRFTAPPAARQTSLATALYTLRLLDSCRAT
jgi:hypothetical protein